MVQPEVERYYGTGRRKTSVARVWLIPGSGQVSVNGQDLETYFHGRASLIRAVLAPLQEAGVDGRYDVRVNVTGGGIAGQAGAIRHGIARALVEADPDLRPVVKKAGYLRRDPRMKERRKYGLKKARKAPQYSKR